MWISIGDVESSLNGLDAVASGMRMLVLVLISMEFTRHRQGGCAQSKEENGSRCKHGEVEMSDCLEGACVAEDEGREEGRRECS